MEVERASLCNCVVNFLLEEKYLLTAFELLHELLDDGREDHAIRLKEYFSDASNFPPAQISKYSSLGVADPQSLFEEKEAIQEKLALSEYERRLAQEDIAKLQAELEKRRDSHKTEPVESSSICEPELQCDKKVTSFADLGPLKDYERRDLNCALKEYLLLAGYRLTAMTFYEEVSDQNLDDWQKSPACVPDALRHYYYQYLSSTNGAAEEKIAMLQENDSLRGENERMRDEISQLKGLKDGADNEIIGLTKSLEALQKDLKDREKQAQEARQSGESQRKELNECRSEITSLKVLLAESLSKVTSLNSDTVPPRTDVTEKCEEEETIPLFAEKTTDNHALDAPSVEVDEDEKDTCIPDANGPASCQRETFDVSPRRSDDAPPRQDSENSSKFPGKENQGLDAIQILADSLPKIVPYVLINHREELLPLIMCAIERHRDSSTRDSLTNTLFNLIKRPDEQQRRIIMDACVTLAENVGEMRTETELLPQCWEQISHTYEERRLLVAQSCGELAGFVRPEIRDSLILSIVQQLIEDPSAVVRDAAAHNLSLLLPLFPNADKYVKVEELLFQLVCDPSGLVLETTLKELLPAVIKWGDSLDSVLRVLLSQILSAAQRCAPVSGVEGSLDSHLLALGERERWTIDVLLRMMLDLVPFIHRKILATSPVSSPISTLPLSSLHSYARGEADWPAFEWLHADCFPVLIQLVCMLPPKEETLRNRMAKFLVSLSEHLGEFYLDNIMLPVFLVAAGDDADLHFFPSDIRSIIQGLKPKTVLHERIATLCVLPLLLTGVLGSPSKRESLSAYLKKLLVDRSPIGTQTSKHTPEIIQAVRFLCIFEEHHSMLLNILWEMVASFDAELKVSAARILKIMVPYCDVRAASTHILPALVTLGSDQNLSVKYASIDAFGSVAQHFKSDVIVDKIRIQMDAFLEDGSHEATVAVVRALSLAVPLATSRLREYLLSKIHLLTAAPSPVSDLTRRRERADAFCEAIRALDATELSSSSVRDFLLPAIQNMMKDPEALDPAHKEALEITAKERSGGAFDAISKVMGAHLGIATTFFGDTGLLGKKDSADSAASAEPLSPVAAEDTRLRRIMRGNFSDMLRGKGRASSSDEMPH